MGYLDEIVEGVGFLVNDPEGFAGEIKQGLEFLAEDANELIDQTFQEAENLVEIGKQAVNTITNDCFKDKKTVEDYNPPDQTDLQFSTFKNASTNLRLIDGIPYRENRVRLSTFSILPAQLREEVPQNLKTKSSLQLHPLALRRLKLMNDAWMAEFGGKQITSQINGKLVTAVGKPLAIASGYRDVGEVKYKYLLNVNDSRTKKYPTIVSAVKLGEKNVKRLFELLLIAKYGSVQKGRKYLAWHSPHGTGLAMDFGSNGLEPISKTDSAQKKTTLFKWLRENAHKFGFSPYIREAWHWEVLVPRENWANGQEFAQGSNYNIRVVEEGTKTKFKTTNRKFPEEFAV